MDKDNCAHELNSRRKLDFVVEEENRPSENSSGEKLTPELHSNIQEKIPKIGMTFENEDAAYKFYNEYARVTGFSIRRHTMHPDSEGRIKDRTFCCSCRGYRPKDKRDVSVKSHRPKTRTGCNAMMKINGRHTGKYEVVGFVADHSGHDLTSPSKTHLLRSHRTINAALATQAADMESSGITPKAGFALMTKQAGGRERVGCIFEDYKNYLHSKRTMQMKAGDTGGVLEYMQQRQLDDPNFFYAIQVDEDDLIANILWIDAQMMADYAHFGDVVSFDTTYRKNKDGRPFALFVGVNHHKQTIIFGASLLYDETASTFMWLFDTFVKAMSGKQPITMLTDQDAAMAKALVERWPNTYHRLCIWHIYQNAAIHLSSVFERFANFAKDFSSCIYDHEEEEEFLTAWNEMLEKYELHTNEWLERMFKIREKWALVYGRQSFGADMTTTQRSESMNSSLKRYVSYKHKLLQFFHHFDRLVDDRRYEELKADLRTSRSTPVSSFPVEISKHAATIYTHEVFELFQAELRKGYDTKVEFTHETGEVSEYKITPCHMHRWHTVTYNSSNSKVSCSCRKFEFAGILCSHALKVLCLKNVMKIPELYILKRWTRKAKKIIVEVGVKQSDPTSEKDEKKIIGVHYRELCNLINQLATKASLTNETFNIAKVGILKMIEEVDSNLENKVDITPTRPVQKNVVSEFVNKPNEVTIRGWKNKEKKSETSGKRPKSGLEKSIRKKKQTKNVHSTNNAIINMENNDQMRGENSLNIGAPVVPDSVPSLSQLSQEYQFGSSGSSFIYPTQIPSLWPSRPFQFAPVFNPVNNQQLNLSPYLRQEGQSKTSLTELLEVQQIATSQQLKMNEFNKSTHQDEHEKTDGESSDVPKE